MPSREGRKYLYDIVLIHGLRGEQRSTMRCAGKEPDRRHGGTPAYDLRFFHPHPSVVEADRQEVIVREFVPEFEDDRAVVKDVTGDDPFGIDLPYLFNPARGSYKHLHPVFPGAVGRIEVLSCMGMLPAACAR